MCVFSQFWRLDSSKHWYLLLRALALVDQGPTLMTSFNLKHPSQAPSNTATLGVSASIHEFEGKNIQSITGGQGNLRGRHGERGEAVFGLSVV